MGKYEEALQSLNPAQRRAVETVDGPVLVIAGPGTGKTQLLTTRVAHILATTDTLPQNILCLTFTESAAQTMRERLAGLIGQGAYDVGISTYHAFGSDLIRRFPDYFVEFSQQRPVDDLGIDAIFREIINGLPYSNPLKFSDTYLGDLKTFVSDAKRALLTPADITKIAEHNETFLRRAQPAVVAVLDKIPRIDKKTIPLFARLADKLATAADTTQPVGHVLVLPLSTLLLRQLHQAVEHAQATGKTTELTKWKNAWLAKDIEGNFILDGQKTNQKLHAAAGIYQQYLTELSARDLFDYDDMILQAVRTLEQNPDLRYSLQERYLYLLLDEFQDTNGAQLRLTELLSDNPVHEGRPNVLAVGDDDQAIYAFQGANYSHMMQFQQLYRDVLVVPLTQNYRSHPGILHLAQGIAGQIEERLLADKTLTAQKTGAGIVQRREAKSDVGQFAWTAKEIKKIIQQGTPASQIAVLAPQHKHLEPLVPFLHQQGIPIRYEKRENVLDDPAISQLLRMSELILNLSNGHHAQANALWAEVLSFDFWQLPTSLIWQLSWQASDDQESWTEVLLQHEQLEPIVLFFIRLSLMTGTETLETILDYLIGVTPLDLQEPGHTTYASPFYTFYFGSAGESRHPGLDPGSSQKNDIEKETKAGTFWSLLTNLTVLRARLRDYRTDDGELLRLQDFVEFVQKHRAANIKILNTSPYQEADDAVQLMTAYKAKGQEFDAVFVLATSDEVWGSRARTQSTRLALPPNLQFIRYAGATNDERLRLFYVAVTRAKSQLYLANYTSNYAGKLMTRLKYLDESTDQDGEVLSPLLPKDHQTVLPAEDGTPAPTTELAAYWQQRHEAALTQTGLRALLQHRLERFQLSPTHVNSFIDLEHQGPAYFFMNTILHFPKAPLPQGEFGSAMHETLEWIHLHNRQHGGLPNPELTVQNFQQRLGAKHLNTQDTALFLTRGQTALRAYLRQRGHTIAPANETEFNFRNEGVFVGQAHMGGKVDKLIIDRAAKTITIVDYKTGKSYHRWTHDAKLHRYKQQLYLYKALVEGSHTFANYKVTGAYLEFVEPDEAGNIQELHLQFDDDQYQHVKKLAQAIWQHIMSLDLPDITPYTPDLTGIEAFEAYLLTAK